MKIRTFGLALALATLPHGYAVAQSTIEAPPGTGLRFQGFLPIDPATGLPYKITGGTSGGAADQTGDNSSNAVAPSATNQHALSFGYYYNATTARWEQVRGSGGASSVNVTNFPTGFNSLQGGAALSPTNALPTLVYTPNAAVSGRTITKTALSASQNASVCPAPTVPLQSTEIQISVAAVGLGFNGQTLNSASYGTATGNPDYIAPAAGTLYTFPVPPTNAVSAYSANAAVVICIQTARQ